MRNTFTDGLVRDAEKSLQPEGTYTYMLNGTHYSTNSKGFGRADELGNELFAEFDGDIVGAVYVEERDESVFFINNDGVSELWTVSMIDGCRKFVGSDKEFGCKWDFGGCEWHPIEVKVNQPCNEYSVYFSSKCTYYVVDITELLDEKRKNALKRCILKNELGACTPTSCDYFKLFSCVCNPDVVVRKSERGGTIEAGHYSASIQLENASGVTTNWSPIQMGVNIGSENNIAGEVGNNAIELKFSCLDCRYDKVNIAIVRTVNGTITVEKFSARNYNNTEFSFVYYGQTGELITLEEIQTKRKTFIQGGDIVQREGRAWLSSIKQEHNLNYSGRALEIGVEGVVYEIPVEEYMERQYPTLPRGENLPPLGIVWNYCDGTHSAAFPIVPQDECETEPEGELQTQVNINRDPIPFRPPTVQRSGRGAVGSPPLSDRGLDEAEGGDSVQGETTAPIDGMTTIPEDFCAAVDCEDCQAASDRCSADVDDLSTVATNYIDGVTSQLTGSTIESGSFNEAASNLASGVLDRPVTIRNRGGITGTQEPPEVPDPPQITALGGTGKSCIPVTPFTDCHGADVDGKILRPVSTFNLGVTCTQNNYPETKDCDGKFLYGKNAGKPIKLFTTPCTSQEPIIVSTQKGVVSQYEPENIEFRDTKVRILGLRFTNIKYPTANELPKPLCPNNPFRIVSMRRDNANKTIIAKGLLTGTFKGNVRGREYAFPRHAVNSFESVDRFVDNDGSHIGEDNTVPAFNFHSLDTEIFRPGLDVTEIKFEGEVFGFGWRHGLYAEGVEPSDTFNDSRIDQKGARQAVHLNQWIPIGSTLPVSDLTYAPADSVVTAPAGITYPLMNRYRESSVYLQLDAPTDAVPALQNSFDGIKDASFVGDVLDHSCPINLASAHYVSLKRELPGQYGTLESAQFFDTGIVANRCTGNEIEGVLGDTYIGPHSFRRTGYVSNKVGNKYRIDGRERTICDSPDSDLLDFVGQYIPTQLPESGDASDPKNYAGLHTEQALLETQYCLSIQVEVGSCDFDNFDNPIAQWRIEYTDQDGPHEVRGIATGNTTVEIACSTTPFTDVFAGFARIVGCEDLNATAIITTKEVFIGIRSRPCGEAPEIGFPETDVYNPRVVKTLVTYWGEFEVNPWLRETGPGSQLETGQVYYNKLKDLTLDSSVPTNSPWPEAYLNRFYCEVKQPTRRQILTKAVLRNIISILLPLFGVTALVDVEGATDTLGFMLSAVIAIPVWYLLNYYLGSNDHLDRLLGIPLCKVDDDGAPEDDCIRQFENNYYSYNWDYSTFSPYNLYFSPNATYNTCRCDDCDDSNNEIYFSDQQIIGSQIDAYKNFKANNYLNIPAHAGRLKKVFALNNRFYAHTTDGIFLIKYGNVTTATSIGTLLLGGGDLLTEPEQIMEGIPEGYAGIQDPNAAIITPHGYFFIDRKASKLHQFDGQRTRPVSDFGLDWLFKYNSEYCSESNCTDERCGNYYTLGWDNCHDRLLITKSDGKYSWTISYTPMGRDGRGQFLGLHSYIPNGYLSTRRDFFSFNKNSVWKHHSRNVPQRNFYGKQYPFIIEFVAIPKDFMEFRYEQTTMCFEVYRRVEKGRVKDEDCTFSKALIYNSTQSTGVMDVKVISNDRDSINSQRDEVETSPGTLKMIKNGRHWTFSEINDNVKLGNEDPIMTECECVPIDEPADGIYDKSLVSKETYDNEDFDDKYLVYRLWFEDPDKEIVLKYIDTITDANDR